MYSPVILRVLAKIRRIPRRRLPPFQHSSAISCVYTAFLALNGITEAFVYGVARSGNDVVELGVVHAAVGCVFAATAPGLVGAHGAVGLVAANSLAMALRSACSIRYSRGYFARGREEGRSVEAVASTLGRTFPRVAVLGAFGASFAVTRWSRNRFYDAGILSGGSWMACGARHVTIGIACVVFDGGVVPVAGEGHAVRPASIGKTQERLSGVARETER